MLVHEICRNNAWKDPAGVALVGETGERQTWQELEARTERVADALYAVGVRQGDRVACLMRNGLEGIHLYLACNKLGALYAPVNYRFAVPEILQVVTDSAPRVMVTHAQYAATAARLRAEPQLRDVPMWVLVGDRAPGFLEFDDAVVGAPARTYAPRISETDPSWICCTGGTTGRPKGVLLSHRNMLACAVNFCITNRIQRDDVYLVAGALFHIALAVPVAYWLAGARTVIMNFEAARALDVIEKEGVTKMVATGTIFKMLVEEMEARPRAVRLRNLDTGGAPVSPGLVRRAQTAFGCTVSQIYGQTEVTLMATYLYPEEYAAGFAADPADPAAKRLESVGRAAPMTVVRVLDERMTPLPPREVGEIAVSGDPVMLGYANLPELTRETVREGWVRSGDLGWMDEDGYVYLVDRKKDMIISGGENVYSSEVELVLARHPQLREAVVIGVPDPHWGERVHAVVVPVTGQTPEAHEIQAFCRQHLAGYKIPKSIECRDELPRLPTGKIAKGEIREAFWRGHERRIHGT